MHSFIHRQYFYGWYLKCQSDSQTLAVIPAVHQSDGKRSCSIQIITDDSVWIVPFSEDAYRKRGMKLSIGKNQFTDKGFRLSIRTPDLSVRGKIVFGSLSPLKYDIMGPFAAVPFMECRHSVWSMRHSVRGTLYINAKKYSFQEGSGYWEGDRGRSFPKRYVWSHCFLPKGSLMLSAADIPLADTHFVGVICNVLWNGKEYRLATYLGAKIEFLQDKQVRITQGDMNLEAQLLETNAHSLQAPANGDMARTIHESASCRAFYRFRKGENTLFAFETGQASFEYEF